MLLEENVSGREKLDLHGGGEEEKCAQVRWRKKSACVCVCCERTFAWCYNARLRVLRMYVCVYCERTFAGVITSVRWFSNVRLRVL